MEKQEAWRWQTPAEMEDFGKRTGEAMVRRNIAGASLYGGGWQHNTAIGEYQIFTGDPVVHALEELQDALNYMRVVEKEREAYRAEIRQLRDELARTRRANTELAQGISAAHTAAHRAESRAAKVRKDDREAK